MLTWTYTSGSDIQSKTVSGIHELRLMAVIVTKLLLWRRHGVVFVVVMWSLILWLLIGCWCRKTNHEVQSNLIVNACFVWWILFYCIYLIYIYIYICSIKYINICVYIFLFLSFYYYYLFTLLCISCVFGWITKSFNHVFPD